jgi:hypothetical protein
MPGANPSNNDRDESQERIVQAIYDHLLRSVVVGYASNTHEMIKTGGISISELQTPSSRQDIFPSLYEGKTPEEIQRELDAYATEMPSRQSRKRKLRQATIATGTQVGDDLDEENKDGDKDDDDDGDDDDDDDEDFKDDNPDGDDDDDDDDGGKTEKSKSTKAPATTKAPETPAITVGQTQERQPPGVDIWNRIPPKEPKHPVECTLCGRHVSTTRFASHLEKCMGLSTRPLPGIPNRGGSSSSSLK